MLRISIMFVYLVQLVLIHLAFSKLHVNVYNENKFEINIVTDRPIENLKIKSNGYERKKGRVGRGRERYEDDHGHCNPSGHQQMNDNKCKKDF